MRRDIIVVDHFLDNPDDVRNYALQQQYQELGKENWPGRNSGHTHGEKEMTQACSEVVGEQLAIKPENKCSYFRITKEGQHGRQHIHFDPKQARSISMREAAILQNFPKTFKFETSQTDTFRMIGNAVSPLMAQKIACGVKWALEL